MLAIQRKNYKCLIGMCHIDVVNGANVSKSAVVVFARELVDGS